jgi:ketosteroid isomerase-like protein
MPDMPTTVVPPAPPADVRPPQTPSSRVTTPADLDRMLHAWQSRFTGGRSPSTISLASLEYKDPSIRVVGNVAIVRFHWLGESETIPGGKKSSTNLHILMNWQKQGGEWKLLSRASTKL